MAGDLARSATGDKADGVSWRSRESSGSFFIWFDNRQEVGLVAWLLVAVSCLSKTGEVVGHGDGCGVLWEQWWELW